MSEKQFPPSEAKIHRLRTEGQFPFSSELLTAAVLAGVVIVLRHWPWTRFLEVARGAFGPLSTSAQGRANGMEAGSYFFSRISDLIPSFVLAVSLGVVGFSLLLWWVQTRFYLRFARVSRSTRAYRRSLQRQILCPALVLVAWSGMMWPFFFSGIRGLGDENRQQGIATAMSNLLARHHSCLKVGANPNGCGFFDYFLPLLRIDGALVWGSVGAALVFCFLIGILTRFMAGLAFSIRHRMSREEVMAEAHEGEAPSAYRGFYLEDVE